MKVSPFLQINSDCAIQAPYFLALIAVLAGILQLAIHRVEEG